jgi:hypothetical protein
VDRPFPKEVAACLLWECGQILGAIEAQSLDSRGENPLPPRLLTCGELCRLVPGLYSLLFHVYPELWDDDTFAAALRDAAFLNNQTVN